LFRFGLYFYFGLGLLVFAFAVPVSWLYVRQQNQWPITTAQASNHQKVIRQGKNKTYEVIVATLTYTHPTLAGSRTCVIDPYDMGGASLSKSYNRTFDVAVRPDSCYGPMRLPLAQMPSLLMWCMFFCIMTVFSLVMAVGAALKDATNARTWRTR
jgi:hypothetical protein